MQQFLLFCSMLIIASEVFSKELRGSQSPKSTNLRTSRFAHKIHYPVSDRYMLRSFNPPMFLVPPAYESPDHKVPFLVPLARCGCEPKCRKNNFLQRKNKRFRNRKRFRRKQKTKRPPTHPVNVPNSFIFNSAESFENFWTSGIQPRRNFTHFFGNVFDSRDFKNPKQYIVCLYPVFIRPERKGTIDFYKKSRFSNLKRQYFMNLRNKKKRSALNLNPVGDISAKESNEKSEKDERHKNSRFPHLESGPVTGGDEAAIETHKNGGIRNENDPYNQNLFTTNSISAPSQKFKYNLYGDSEKYRGKISPSQLNMGTDFYNGFLDVTQPSVTLPKITFKYPYDPMLYESPYDSVRFLEKPPQKETSPEENVKRNVETSSFTNLGKIKQMLNEVESMLTLQSDQSKDLNIRCQKKGDAKKNPEQVKSAAEGNYSTSLKEKIDTVVIPILSQISKDLGQIANRSTSDTPETNDPNPNATDINKKPKIRCSPDGTWQSSVLETEMTFTTMPNMMLKVNIVSTNNSVLNKKWSIQGLTLSKRGGPLILAAIYPQKRKIASFIGQCKMCQDKDMIFGSWTIYTCMQRFTDLWKAVETKLDILRRVEISTLSVKKKVDSSDTYIIFFLSLALAINIYCFD